MDSTDPVELMLRKDRVELTDHREPSLMPVS
jgi:hypothetical protein